MTLQDIVAYCNQLQEISTQQDCDDALRKLEAVLYTVTTHPVQSQDISQRLQNKFDEIKQNFADFDSLIQTIRTNLQQVLIANDQHYIDMDVERYQAEQGLDTADSVLNRAPNVLPGVITTLTTSIRRLVDWRLPGLIVRPAKEDFFIDPMVTFDPLYVADHGQEYLDPFTTQFPELYQRRIRRYIINENGSQLLMHLPVAQFGVILMYNFLNYKPLPLLLRYVSEAFELLRPGGTMIMTFNDCDVGQNMGLCERRFMMYQPWRLIEPVLTKVGYEIKALHRPGGDVVWAELGRPGEITSLRGNAPMAKIVAN